MSKNEERMKRKYINDNEHLIVEEMLNKYNVKNIEELSEKEQNEIILLNKYLNIKK